MEFEPITVAQALLRGMYVCEKTNNNSPMECRKGYWRAFTKDEENILEKMSSDLNEIPRSAILYMGALYSGEWVSWIVNIDWTLREMPDA